MPTFPMPSHKEPPARRPVPSDIDVLVVGAGPTGPTAAHEALRHGLTVRIIDRKPGREAISKALVVHARTMEVFEAMGLAEAVLAEGLPSAAFNVHAGRNRPFGSTCGTSPSRSSKHVSARWTPQWNGRCP